MSADRTFVSLFDARTRLLENRDLLSQTKHKTAYNMNESLLHIVSALDGMREDIGRLQNMVDVALKNAQDDKATAESLISNRRRP